MFYIRKKGDLNWDSEYSNNQLGEVSYNKFWTSQGFSILKKNIDRENITWLTNIEIFDDHLKQYSIEDFFTEIQKYMIINE